MLPELETGRLKRVRLPGEVDVPITDRVQRIIDTAGFQRLKHISQLGLVAQVYPGAKHSRFEHSLGVYRLGCRVLGHLLETESKFASDVAPNDAELFLLGALLHDIGHWPYCHPIEDMGLGWVPRHEDVAEHFLLNEELNDLLATDWNVSARSLVKFLSGRIEDHCPLRVLQNVLGGPIDIDKMDYLQRDSLHAGVPYGRNFDIGRLIASQCIDSAHSNICITEKGKTAAEMMVFARYVMFSEVYWHHAVRSATAMLQRLVFELCSEPDVEKWLGSSDTTFGENLRSMASDTKSGAKELAEGLFGNKRMLYKRFAQFHYDANPTIHQAFAGKPFDQLVHYSQSLAAWLQARQPGLNVGPMDVLIDAPPVKLEVQFKLSVRTGTTAEPSFKPLETISPVVKALATQQFDSYVKKVRVFVSPRIAASIQVDYSEVEQFLLQNC